MKKIGAILITILMALSLLTPCFADDPLGKLDGKPGQSMEITEGHVTIPGINDSETTKATNRGQSDFWNRVFTKYRTVILGVSGVCVLTFLLLFIVNFTKLGKSAGNPQMRSQAIMGIIVTGIALALTGGVGLVFGIFYRFF